MSSWLENLTTAGNVLQKMFSNTSPPNKVLEVKSDKYSNRTVICREDNIVFYGPTNNDNKYEIVILRAYCDLAYSLYRSEVKDEVEIRFLQYKDKIPVLISISATVNSLSGIQKVCDVIQDHPSWTITHLAVFLNLTDCLNSEQVLSHLNTPDALKGESPLMLAIKEQQLAVVKALVNAKASLEHLDHEANSVFHYAASTNKDIILALLTSGQPRCLNYRNICGYTPLHIACLADKPDCVQTLLAQGADVNISATKGQISTMPPGFVGDFMEGNAKKLYVQDMKFGGTPLHWASSREVIEQLVDRNCDLNVLNFDKRTALHVMVMRNRLDCVVALLSRHADPDIGDVDGNTALHFAVKANNIPVIQALIVFGADLSSMNNEGHTVRHFAAQETDEVSNKVLFLLHAVGAPRCVPDIHGCTDGCLPNGTRDGIPPPDPPCAQVRAIMKCFQQGSAGGGGSRDTVGGRVLCLDGGGIRGLVLVTILLHVEARVQQPIIHSFDWIAGTSTGAILALALAAGKSLKDCLCLYFRMKEYAFVGPKPYPSEPLETMLQQALGTETVMADTEHPKLIITGVLADRKPVDLHLFRNYPSPSELLDPHDASRGDYPAPASRYEQLVWKAARASGAAPSYFRAFGRYIDGGLIANNPTMDALTEIHEYNTALRCLGRDAEVKPPTVVVSVGTGCIPVKQLPPVDVFRPESIWDSARLVMGISALGTLLVDQATLADGRVIDRCNAWCSMIGVPYFRFSPQLSEDVAMDEKNDAKLVNMLWETKAYIMRNDEAVCRLASLLTGNRSLAQDAKSNKRLREESFQTTPQDIKFLSKKPKLENPSCSEDDSSSSYNLWKKYF
ncbi:85/88 kDa calcium-independent phospholipase A2-like isoform X2 [Macrosteles quadrilineatus]|uniref:85/88 kDa calcium-independent phospholipase A2-like isoform X2 n=1 Tax=Macrosteles quadrilineatus TaxID=74068 RepID=UPI0023E0AB19|nr:85/88 kDa calcium-independent phospholipase A2-like isoform X2 [Macrosteles quadrilineatus]